MYFTPFWEEGGYMQLPNAVVFCYCNDYLNLFNYSMFLIYFLISCLLLSLFTPVLVCQWLFALYTHSVFNWTHLPGTDWNDLTNLYLEFQVCYLAHNKEQSKTSGVPLDYFQKTKQNLWADIGTGALVGGFWRNAGQLLFLPVAAELY